MTRGIIWHNMSLTHVYFFKIKKIKKSQNDT